MLPFGVVVPTKNSMRYLPAHLANLAAWIDLAEQVVVVDSDSTDGTVEFLKKNLRHPRVCFATHPPGLYASWNHGIRQLTTEFCYLSTVGDSVSRAGLEHLVSTAAELRCDVLVSRPDFLNEAGEPVPGPDWPMAEMVRRLNLAAPVRLPAAIVLATALTHTGGAITGSCASDVFRTAILQQAPVPLDFGTAGDGAWCLQQAARLQWAATPAKVTTFRCHPPTASAGEVKTAATAEQLALMARQAVLEWLAADPHTPSTAMRAHFRQLMELLTEHAAVSRRYNSLRKTKWPWFMNRAAWQARSRRDQIKPKLARVIDNIYQSVDSGWSGRQNFTARSHDVPCHQAGGTP